jgi:hypothetical protein
MADSITTPLERVHFRTLAAATVAKPLGWSFSRQHWFPSAEKTGAIAPPNGNLCTILHKFGVAEQTNE